MPRRKNSLTPTKKQNANIKRKAIKTLDSITDSNVSEQDGILDADLFVTPGSSVFGDDDVTPSAQGRDPSDSGYSSGKKHRKKKPKTTPLINDTPRRGRLINLRQQDIDKIKEHMEKLVVNYKQQPWNNKNNQKTTPKKTNQLLKCGDTCDCASQAQCHQNALAYIAAHQYDAQFHPKKIPTPKFGQTVHHNCHAFSKYKCAACGELHRVDYYDSGRIGDYVCDKCKARLLKSEHALIKQGRLSQCCLNGAVDTETMRSEYKELQNPQEEFLTELVQNPNEEISEEFMNKAVEINNMFALASTHGEKAPDTELGGRADTCKYNGNFSFHFSDLIAPHGRTPLFAQTYMMLPQDASKIRQENINSALGHKIREEIVESLEKLMRKNPYGKAFETVGQITSAYPPDELPHFEIALLTNRDFNKDLLVNTKGCTLVERVDVPTCKQVAVIWVSEDGIAPKVSAFWVSDKAGAMREITSGMPQLDPCCFPVLAPRGTPGWRYYMKKKNTSDKIAQQHDNMQKSLDASALRDHVDDLLDLNNNNETENAQDPVLEDTENDLDDDIAEQELEQGGDISAEPNFYKAHDTVVEADVNYAGAAKATSNSRENITRRNFYRYRMEIRNDDKYAFHWLWFARRLCEYFVITVLNRVERAELDYVKELQKKKNYRSILAREFISVLKDGAARQGKKLGQVYLTPDTFMGSGQYYRKKYAELMVMVRKLGNPTWFVTFTGNPRWPEIEEALQGRQEYQHRPDVVCRIFIDKATEFIKDLTEKHVLGKVAGWCYSVEHQKRGMPHIHFLLILDKNYPVITPEDVDQYVCARVPAMPPLADQSWEAKQQRRLWYYVTTMMMHDCNQACLKKNPSTGENICTKHFPKLFTDHTILSDVRYTNYLRLNSYINGQHGHIASEPSSNENSHEPDNDHLRPDNDPEHNAQVLYKRRPPVGETFENTGLIHYRKKGRGDTTPLILGDDRVIAYNPFLLLKYGCHINIEYTFGQKACKYIFKYVLKGFEKAYVNVLQKSSDGKNCDSNIVNYDEIASTFKVRYMTAMEAYLRLHSYKVVEMSHQIYNLPVHDDNGQTIVLEEGHEFEAQGRLRENTRLLSFFELCQHDELAKTLRYEQIPYYFYWDGKNKYWKKRKNIRNEDVLKAKMFVRIYTVSPVKTELFALRCILLHAVGPTSFESLKTVNGITYNTYNEAAKALGLLECDEMYYRAMNDACTEISSMIKLQRFFAMLMVHCRPASPQKFFDHFIDQLLPAPTVGNANQSPMSLEERRSKVMRNLEYFFVRMGTCSKTIGLYGVPADFNYDKHAAIMDEVELLDAFFGDSKKADKTFKQVALDNIQKFNSDQKKVFQRIAEALHCRIDKRNFFVEGSGGCGKTYLYNGLIRWMLTGMPESEWVLNGMPNIEFAKEHDHNNGELVKGNVISAASTGIAALLLIGGGTVHRMFKVPNNVKDSTTPKVGAHTVWGNVLRETKLIIIDEISMLSVKVLRYVDRLLRDLCETPLLPFGGKVLVLGGDWKQLTPVVKNGTKEDQIRESIKLDPLFVNNFETLRLSQNMRTEKGQHELCEWLLTIGEGKQQIEGEILKLTIPKKLVASSMDDFISFCFPPELFDDPLANADLIAQNAILCPTNNDVDAINAKLLSQLKGHSKEYLSIDEPLDLFEANSIYRSDFNIEAIHNECPSGLPPHNLTLKVGAPIMLIRNLDVSQGLCNGTRMQIMKMTPDTLHCRILTGPRAGAQNIHVIPRIKFEYGREEGERGLRFKRLQFPVRPCFAMTINKAQGQTLKKMGLAFFEKQAFSHGQVYVAFSRVTTIDGIKVFSPSTCKGDDDNFIVNVVYHELLDGVMPQHTRKKPPNKKIVAKQNLNNDYDLNEDFDIFSPL